MARKTNQRKELEGNPGKRSLKPKLKATAGVPACPSDLTPLGVAEFDYVVAILKGEDRLYSADYQIVAQHCRIVEFVAAAEEAIAKHGLLIKSRDRGMVKNPAIQIHRTYLDLYQKSCRQLGITPSARDATPAVEDLDPEGLLD